jgi:DNA-binding SARP family transcriptional activator/WD40 repeat protein
VEIKVLGPVQVLSDGGQLSSGGLKQRTVLALLTAAAGRPVSVDGLVNAVYGPDADPSTRRIIHTYISNLRHQLGDVIGRAGDGYRLEADSVEIDAVRFEAMYRSAMSLGDSRPSDTSHLLRAALGLWRGHAYSDVDANGMLDAETTRLHELRLTALEARIDSDLARGLHRELVGELGALTLEYPLREALRAQHMIALYRSGRQSDALRAFTTTRLLLLEELGVDPSPELQELEQRILSQDRDLNAVARILIERRAVLAAAVDTEAAGFSQRERDDALAHRDAALLERAAAVGGSLVAVSGATALAAFPTVVGAVMAATTLAHAPLTIAIDFGEVESEGDRMTGPPLNRSLRLAAVGQPGQVLLSAEAHAALADSQQGGWSVISLGRVEIEGIDGASQLYQLAGGGLPAGFGPLRLDRLPPPLIDGRLTGSIPGFELRAEIGSGVTGVVNRAYQASVGREVAVRIFRPGLVSEPSFIRRFEATATKVAALDHPHLVPLLDYWREPGRAAMVHRLVAGARPREQESNERGLHLIETVGSALEQAHSHGLVHGRVHPGNVLFDTLGNPHLADLGVMAMVAGLVPPPADRYTAPEVAGGRLEASADVFSLGVMATELLEGDERLVTLFARATHPDTRLRTQSVAEFLTELRGAVSPHRPSPRRAPRRNPYKGLNAFGEGDTDDFFGRQDMVEQLLAAVSGRRLTTVVGPSGTGKSSLVRAGLIPALRSGAIAGSERWLFTDMVPGAAPFDALERALQRVATNPIAGHIEAVRNGQMSLPDALGHLVPEGAVILLLIDQFEELFTLVRDETTRRQFLAVLSDVSVDDCAPLRLVCTLRADFFDQPLRYTDFGELLAGSVMVLAAPTAADLTEMIERPAANVGVVFDPDLLDALVADADRQVGALPLLEHTLAELFIDRTSDRLSLGEYRDRGRLAGSLGRRAEAIFAELAPDDQAAARTVFLRLVTVNETSDDTRRRVRRSELGRLVEAGSLDRVLDAFGRHRLLVFDRDPTTRGPTVEVAHEALISRWDRFAAWIDEVREDLIVGRRVELAAGEWAASGSDPSFLIGGARLEQAESWREQAGSMVGEDEAAFLTASRARVEAERERVRRGRRRVLTGLSLALVISIGLAGVAGVQGNIARRRTIETQILELTSNARLAMEEDPNLAVNLALSAYDRAKSLGDPVPGEVLSALQTTASDSRLLAILPDGKEVVAVSPDGSRLVVGAATASINDLPTGGLVVYSMDDFQEVDRFDAGGPVGGAQFTPDGSTLIVWYYNGGESEIPPELAALPAARLFDAGTFAPVGEFGECCDLFGVVSPDGLHWAAASIQDGTNRTSVWSLSDLSAPRWSVTGSALGEWMPDSKSLIVVSNSLPNVVARLDVRTGAVLDEATIEGTISSVSTSASTSEIALGFQAENKVRIYRPGDPLPVREIQATATGAGVYSSDGTKLALFGNNDIVTVLDIASDRRLELRGNPGGVYFLAFSPDGSRLVALAYSGETLVWDVSRTGSLPGTIASSGDINEIELVSDGREMLVTAGSGHAGFAARFDVSTGAEMGRSPQVGWGFLAWPAVSNSFTLVGGIGLDGEPGGLISIATGLEVMGMEGCELPLAIDDNARFAVIGGYGSCVDGGSGTLVEVATGEVVVNWPELPLAAGFGRVGTPSADLVAVNRDFSHIELRELPTGRLVASMTATGIFFQPRFSADGRWLVFGSQAAGATVIDVKKVVTGTPMEDAVALKAHIEGGPTQFAAAQGNLLVTTHSGKEVRVWRSDTREEWFVLPVDTGNFTSAAFSPDGGYLYYEVEGGVIRRMPLDEEELVDLARSRTFRDFNSDECRRYLPKDTDCSVYRAP